MTEQSIGSNSLDIWCRHAGVTNAQLGAALDCDPVSALRYRRFGRQGGRFPRPDALQRIFDLTEGQVDANSLAGLPSLAEFAERLVEAGLPFGRVASVFADVVKQPHDPESPIPSNPNKE